MTSLFVRLSLVTALASVCCSSVNANPQKKEFTRMGSYELMSINVQRDAFNTPTGISFSAYGQDYTLKLQVNEALVMGNVRHTNGIPEESEGYITSLKTSCHYLVRSQGFVGGVSVCPGRGVRGHIKTPDNDVLIFRPSSFYLSDEFVRSDPSVEHLVFRKSEFDLEGIPQPEGMTPSGESDDSNLLRRLKQRGVQMRGLNESQIPKFGGVEQITEQSGHKESNDVHVIAENLSGMGSRRKLMKYNDGKNQIEVLIFVDPSLYEYWRLECETGCWYEEGVASVADYINDVTAVYLDTNWGRSIGDISLHIVEIEVATKYSGTYKSLEPDFISKSCKDYTNEDCEINGSGYLFKLRTWIGYYKDTSTFDNVQLLSFANFEGASGWGFSGTVCKGSTSASATTLRFGDYFAVRTIAHELGHNFDCKHDQDTPCGIDAGLMGYGKGEGFSSCSIEAVQEYFDQMSGLSCLGTGVRDFTSNFGDGSTFDDVEEGEDDEDDDDDAVATPAPVEATPAPVSTDSTDSTDPECIEISGLVKVRYDGYKINLNSKWTYDGTYNSKPYYVNTIEGTTWYLFYNGQHEETSINSELTDSFAWAVCEEQNPLDCTEFEVYVNDWTPENSATVTDCSSSAGQEYDAAHYTDDGDDDTDCEAYSCINIRNLDIVHGNDYNGKWVPTGCHNDEAYYMLNDYYLYFSSTHNTWNIYESLDDRHADAYCSDDTLTDCSGIFQVFGGYDSNTDRDSVVSYCSGFVELAGMPIPGSNGSISSLSSVNSEFNLDWEFSTNCSHPYNSFCLYSTDDNSLWKGHASFTYSACKDGYPYFYYAYEEGNYTMMYYLHYNSVTGWYLSERNLMDTAGVAFCQEQDITKCGAGTWYVVNDATTDVVSYDLSQTMKYEDICVVSDSSSSYCTSDSSGACAMWQMELEVTDSTQKTKVCDVLNTNCVTEGLNSDSSQAGVQTECLSDYQAKLYFNCTFDTTAGYLIYSEYVQDYKALVETCEGSDDLKVEVVYSTLHVCESCSNFVHTSAESGAHRFGVVHAGMEMIAIVVCAMLAWI